jgi:cellulose biosynthesis protein BcsQ
MPILGTIPTTTAIRQAQAARVSIATYKRNSAATKAFENITGRILEIMEEKSK